MKDKIRTENRTFYTINSHQQKIISTRKTIWFQIFQVAGIALIVVGAIPLFKLDDIRDAFPENNPAIVPILVLILGSIIFTISFFGCCGAIRVMK